MAEPTLNMWWLFTAKTHINMAGSNKNNRNLHEEIKINRSYPRNQVPSCMLPWWRFNLFPVCNFSLFCVFFFLQPCFGALTRAPSFFIKWQDSSKLNYASFNESSHLIKNAPNSHCFFKFFMWTFKIFVSHSAGNQAYVGRKSVFVYLLIMFGC